MASQTASIERSPSIQDLKHPARLIALGFGSGLSKYAPGTVGTAWGWLSFNLFLAQRNDITIAIVWLSALFFGWWACKATSDALGSLDSGHIVWDEILAFWLVLWLLGPSAFGLQLLAFLLFRFFDAAKPQPVKWADSTFKGTGWRGAWGIIWDDLVAAFCSLLVLAVLHQWLG
ncbi:phosphatidylglycerophosphatase A [Lampropedia puyangensis]|uniref:Phosphatidylglycerophosphatase A n=1 Tax=Lampropedia puyangensis TaxID=1330072 RepID=A0A4S8F8Z8_9BURK|nr:phosphatidylglycerophosphatase A [Lampropedia puyangensis]THU02744.1 phosphatidylglycerophosphatase A [Lampropedia puyangensis]